MGEFWVSIGFFIGVKCDDILSHVYYTYDSTHIYAISYTKKCFTYIRILFKCSQTVKYGNITLLVLGECVKLFVCNKFNHFIVSQKKI